MLKTMHFDSFQQYVAAIRVTPF